MTIDVYLDDSASLRAFVEDLRGDAHPTAVRRASIRGEDGRFENGLLILPGNGTLSLMTDGRGLVGLGACEGALLDKYGRAASVGFAGGDLMVFAREEWE